MIRQTMLFVMVTLLLILLILLLLGRFLNICVSIDLKFENK